jgi:prepilin peptidase CpaA
VERKSGRAHVARSIASAMRELLQLAPLVAAVLWAAAIDVRARRIPNWLTFPLVVTGLAHAWLAGSALTPPQSWAGLATGLGITFAFFALNVMSAGDVKLMAGIGAWMGPLGVLQVFVAEAVAGLVIVAVQAARGRELASLLRGSAVIVLNAAHGDWRPPQEPKADEAKFHRLPYAVPVLVGVIVVVLARSWRWL